MQINFDRLIVPAIIVIIVCLGGWSIQPNLILLMVITVGTAILLQTINGVKETQNNQNDRLSFYGKGFCFYTPKQGNMLLRTLTYTRNNHPGATPLTCQNKSCL